MSTFFYGILDSDSTYSILFANYLNNQTGLRNHFLVFTDIDSLSQFQFKDDLRILFISDDLDIDLVKEHISVERIIVLADSHCDNPGNMPYRILKYDSPEDIFYKAQKLLAGKCTTYLTADEHPLSFFCDLVNDDISYSPYNFKFIGMYNPYNLQLQTSYCLATATVLSEYKPVLFIDLARFSPIKLQNENHGAFSDLIFYFRSNKESLADKLPSIICHDIGFDYIAPPGSAEDISSFPKEIFSSCLHFLAGRFGYGYIIVNFGDYLNPLCDYFSCCHKILVPVSDNLSPLTDIYNYLHLSGLSQLLTSIVEVSLINLDVNRLSDNPDNIIKKIKSSPEYGKLSEFVVENIIKGGLSDVRSNKK